MVEPAVLLLRFVMCGISVCGGPVYEKKFDYNSECHHEMNRRVLETHGVFACVLARQWIDDKPRNTNNICKPFSKEKDCHQP